MSRYTSPGPTEPSYSALAKDGASRVGSKPAGRMPAGRGWARPHSMGRRYLFPADNWTDWTDWTDRTDRTDRRDRTNPTWGAITTVWKKKRSVQLRTGPAAAEGVRAKLELFLIRKGRSRILETEMKS